MRGDDDVDGMRVCVCNVDATAPVVEMWVCLEVESVCVNCESFLRSYMRVLSK